MKTLRLLGTAVGLALCAIWIIFLLLALSWPDQARAMMAALRAG